MASPHTSYDFTDRRKWRESLLKNVLVIPKYGIPGTLLVWGNKCEPILSSENGTDVVMAAAEMGQGRVVIFSHDGYTNAFFENADEEMKQLNKNIAAWVLKPEKKDCSSNIRKIKIDQYNDLDFLKEIEKNSILVWSLPSASQIGDETFLTGITNFVHNGGAMVLGVCPWGWLQLNPGKILSSNPHNVILDCCGVCYTEDYAHVSEGGIIVSGNQAGEMHLGYALELLQAGDTQLALNHPILCKNGLCKLPTQVTQGIAKNKSVFLEKLECCQPPSKCNPVKTGKGKADMSFIEMIFNQSTTEELKGLKAPGVSDFPGDFEISPPLVTVELQIDSCFAEWHSTGYYLPAGQDLVVTCSGDTFDQWFLRVGCHTDVLQADDEYRRWPNITKVFPICTNVIRACSPFGGLVYFESPEGKSSLKAKLENVVECPYFDLCDQDSVNTWPHRKHAQGLWAELAGELITITLPSSAVRHVENPTQIVKLYDSLIANYHSLRGTDPRSCRRERLVTDEQPCVGYMHAGYPVVTHLDVADPNMKNHVDAFLLNAEYFSMNGMWGVFHEFGHNFQRDIWTFDGTAEVTVNIFTLYGQYIISGIETWMHPRMEGFLGKVKQALNYSEFPGIWKPDSDPFVDLFIYIQLVNSYGWDTIKLIFRMYEKFEREDKEKVKNNQDKVDLWLTRFSEVVHQNLCPLFDFWGVTVSHSVKNKLGHLKPFFPKDQVTELAPARTEVILRNYPGITRQPEPVNHEHLWNCYSLTPDKSHFAYVRHEPYTKLLAK